MLFIHTHGENDGIGGVVLVTNPVSNLPFYSFVPARETSYATGTHRRKGTLSRAQYDIAEDR